VLLGFSQSNVSILMFILQGIMVMRVHALLGNSKKILGFLVLCFVVTQVLCFTSVISVLSVGITLADDFQAFGVRICRVDIPRKLEWTLPLSAAAAMSMEIVLNIQVIRYVVESIEYGPSRRSLMQLTQGIAGVLVRDNLFYFFAVTAAIFLTSFSELNALKTIDMERIIYDTASQLSQSLVAYIVGPWMILSLRQHHEQGLGSADSNLVSSLRFAGVPQSSTIGDV